MEAFLVLLGLYLFAVLLVLPVWTLIKFSNQRREHLELQHQLNLLQQEIQSLRSSLKNSPPAPAAPASAVSQPFAAPAPVELRAPPPAPATPPVIVPPPVIVAPAPPPPPIAVDTPPLLPPVLAPTPPVYVPPRPVTPVINWEQFMGAKLFAWLGGFALFLGVAFFVKYSFDHDLIPPAVRVALGFIFGLGLIVGGLKISHLRRYLVLSQTLLATGVVSLYAVTFTCNSIYHFDFFGPLPTFLLMALITATAFILAVRLEAPVVAILGILGGFLTPVLIKTGHDNPVGLFGYLALLDVGLLAVALNRRWFYLVPLGAAGTVLLMIAWAANYYEPWKTTTAMTVCLGFCALFIGGNDAARRLGRHDRLLTWSAAAMPLVAFGFAFFFLDYPTVAARAGLFLGFVLLVDAALLTLVWRDDTLPRLHLVGGLIAFALFGIWTGNNLTDELLPWALAAYLLFAVLHTVFPLLLERRRPTASGALGQLFPPLTLLLMLVPIFKLDAVSVLLWPAILLVDVLAIALAVLSASLAAVAAVLVLTLLATGICIFRLPTTMAFDSSLLLVIGGFAVFFFAASLWLIRKLGAKLPSADQKLAGVFGDARSQLPAFASLLPFLLLIMVCLRLDVPDPSAVFGLGLLLVVLTLGLARLLVIEWLPACALVGMAALEFSWFQQHRDDEGTGLPLVWYLGFYAVFTVYPFLFRRVFSRLTGPWAVAALSGLAHFWMIYQTLKPDWPEDFLGAIPALFALAPVISLGLILRYESAENPARLNQLAWFGGMALFFITLVFPIQFERQWLTVAWALEGAALLWLFHRVPHPGLRGTGAVLLTIAFVRLALNPAVFAYHARGDTALFNWYLYAYGIATVALFVGARLTAPPRDRVLGIEAPPFFNALGVILAFFLLNIEIADYFTPIGAHTLTWQFSGSFARDMSYTIGWALFALGLLVAGIWRATRPARYTAIVLLSVALLKLFFHDLARLQALYRIGALFAVAVIAILASFAYQRFLPGNEKSPPPQS